MSLLDDLHQICIEKGVSIAVAESCTSGLIASKLSQKPGSSNFFKGGVVAYQNEIKANVLGVSQLVIDKKTEVSSEVVTQMIYGESFSVYQKKNKWLKIKIKEENYKGYIKKKKI